MHLVKFLTIGLIFSLVLGEFGHYPFGGATFAIRLTDVLLSLTLGFLAVWQIGIKKKILLPKEFILIIIFWLIGFLSLIYAANFKGFFYLLRFILYSLAFWLSYSLVKTKTLSFQKLLSLMVFSGVILALLGIFQLIVYPDFESLTLFGFDPHKYRLASTFLDPNFLGAFLNIILLFSFYLLQKRPTKIFFLVNLILLISIILTNSRSALLMLFVQILLLGIFKNKYLIILLISLAVLIYFFVPAAAERVYNGLTIDESAGERFKSWGNGLYIFKQNPIFGVGFDNLREALEKNNLVKVYSDNGGHAGAGIDSAFVFLLATTGIVGLLAYFSFWFFLVRNILTKDFTKDYLPLISLTLIISLFIDTQFINSLFYTPIMLIIYLFFGGISGLKDQEE